MLTKSQIIKKKKINVEHPFGTIKKVWGYSTLLFREIENLAAQISLMTLAYNMRRAFTIIEVSGLINELKSKIYRISAVKL
ncbi:MAG: transposase [Melioribacteraceae bacterium]